MIEHTLQLIKNILNPNNNYTGVRIDSKSIQ